MNKVQVLDKIKRNLDQRGIVAVRGADSVTAAGIVISYIPAVIQAPMGGIDGSVSPFLGIGIANPGKLQAFVNVANAAAIVMSADMWVVMREVFGFANDAVITTQDTVVVSVPAHADWQGMGQ